MAKNNADSIFRALVDPWTKTDTTHHSGGGSTSNTYSGFTSYDKTWHTHDWSTTSKSGNVNSGNVHGMEHRPWTDKDKK